MNCWFIQPLPIRVLQGTRSNKVAESCDIPLSQFDGTQEGGVFVQGYVGCGPRDQQLQVVADHQVHDTWRRGSFSNFHPTVYLAFCFQPPTKQSPPPFFLLMLMLSGLGYEINANQRLVRTSTRNKGWTSLLSRESRDRTEAQNAVKM